MLAMGSLKFLYHDYNVLSYGRFNQEEQVIVVINNRNERVHVEIPVWLTGINRSSVAKLTPGVCDGCGGIFFGGERNRGTGGHTGDGFAAVIGSGTA